jgi:hypothetical protein
MQAGRLRDLSMQDIINVLGEMSVNLPVVIVILIT